VPAVWGAIQGKIYDEIMEKKRWVLLFFLSAAYILIYNLAPLTIGIALLFVLEDWLKKKRCKERFKKRI